jgi:enediyne biosynthesis protein E4
VDILAGNYGLNTRLKASVDQPIRTFINDFDQNGSIEHILTISQDDQHLPIVLKNDLLKQIPPLRKNLPRYSDYKNKNLEDLFDEEILNKSLVLEVQTLATMLFENDGEGKFKPQNLPKMMQSSPIYSILPLDIPYVDKPMILLGGNQSRIKPELGSQMGNYGLVIQRQLDGNFTWIPPQASGVYLKGEIRDLIPLQIAGEKGILVLKNNETPEWLKLYVK